MLRRVVVWAGVLVTTCGVAIAFAQTTGSIKITAARANVRATPDAKGAIVGQATAGMVLALKGVEGDWFHVEVMVGTVRVQAYIAKSVATLLPPPPSAPAPAAPAAPPPPPSPPEHVRDGLSVALQTKGSTSWLFPESAVVH